MPTKKIEDIEFLRFYEAYPSKKARGGAEKSWKKLTDGMTNEERKEFATTLVLALDSQKKERSRKRDHGDFVPEWPMPATWLNQQRWLDEVKSNYDFMSEKTSYAMACKKCGEIREGKGMIFQNGDMILCNSCYPDTAGRKKIGYDNMKEMGYGRENFSTKGEWTEACRKWCISHGYSAERPDALEFLADTQEAWNNRKG